MGETSYSRVGKRAKCHVSNIRGGFRINSKRFSVQRLRSRFIFFLKIFNKLRSSYGHALRSIKKGLTGSCRNGGGTDIVMGLKRNSSTSSTKGLMGLHHRDNQRGGYFNVKKNKNVDFGQYDCNRLRSFGRSNSFYAEAIADCLEFIKRSSISVDQSEMLVSSSKLVV